MEGVFKMEKIKTLNLNESLLECSDDMNLPYSTSDETIKELIESQKENKYYSGLCTRCDIEGNLTIDINGVKCIMPADQVSLPLNKEEVIHRGVAQKKVGTHLKAKVLKVEDKTIYLTRLELIEKIRGFYNENLSIGMGVTGKITNIDEKKGVFVDIGGDYVGIIPRNLLENLYVTDLSYHVSVGETVEVLVAELMKNDEGNIVHLVLDRKSLLPKFQKLANNYKKNDIVLGQIKSIQPTGIYCSLDKHLDIICDFDSKHYKNNERVQIRINSVTYEKQRIKGTIISTIQ
jgi:ribosomal protein S1